MNMVPYNEFDAFGSTDGFNSFGAIGTGVGLILAIYLVILGVSLLLGLVSYIMGAVGMHTLANRRGIRHGWLAWIPLGNVWILGSLSDQFQYVVKGKIRNRRKVLLGLNIATVVLTIPLEVVAIFIARYVEKMVAYSTIDPVQALPALAVVLVVALAMLVIYIVNMVHTYIAYYNLFFSCTPDDAVLFLVLSILFPVALPFFVFALRKKDNGMPPRKSAPVIEE